jgi:phosphoribosylformylglycinamidine synthase
VVGGNVSLYNEGGEGPIHPTPVVGMVGRIPSAEGLPGSAFAEEGHAVALVGPFRPDLAGSELEKLRGRQSLRLPAPDLAEQAVAIAALRAAARGGGLATAHDVSEGGLACALAECCIGGGLGIRVELPAALAPGLDAALVGEGPGGAVVAGPRAAVAAVPGAVVIGEVGGDRLVIEGALDVAVADLAERFEGAIPAAFA